MVCVGIFKSGVRVRDPGNEVDCPKQKGSISDKAFFIINLLATGQPSEDARLARRQKIVLLEVKKYAGKFSFELQKV